MNGTALPFSGLGHPYHKETWRWIRIYCDLPCKDPLLLDAIEPACTMLASKSDRGAAFYFERSCVNGPNILLGVMMDTPQLSVALMRCIQQIREYVGSLQCASQRSEIRDRDIISTIARYEARVEEKASQHPTNCILEDCQPPASMLDAGPLLESIRLFKAASSDLVLSWLKLIRAETHTRAEIALRCLIGAAWLGSRKQLRAHLSFRSHVEGFLRDVDVSGRLRSSFSAHYDSAQGESVRQMAIATVAALECGQVDLPRFCEYLDLVRSMMNAVASGLQAGRYEAPPIETLATRLSGFFGPDDKTRFSDAARLLDVHPEVRSWQITVNLIYTVLNQLGISPIERFFACYCISHAAEEVYGESPEAIRALLFDSNRAHEVFSICPDPQSSPVGLPDR